jgi:hypothetical protein
MDMSVAPDKSELERSGAVTADATGASGVPTNATERTDDVSEARRRVMKRLAAGAFAAPVVLASLEAKAIPGSGIPR